MTDNIRKNGYSWKNPRSNIWAIQTDYPTLMKLLIDSVLTDIVSTITNHPDSIVFNGSVLQVWDSLNNMFTFNSLFPLLGEVTDFNYRIKYTVFRWMINGIDTQIVPFDSLAAGNFSVTIQTGAVTPDTFSIKCWDRSIGFYNNNTKITMANLTMNQLEVRFTYDPGLAKYDYTNAAIELTTSGGAGGKMDKESIGLMKNGLIFSGIIPLEANENSTVNDGKLQVRLLDKIYAVFHNSEKQKLPLDTLKDSITFNASSDINEGLSPSLKAFHFYISKTGNREPVIFLQNMPVAGELEIYTARGQCVFKKELARGNAVLRFGAFKSSALYIVNLKYGSAIVKEKVIIP
jgi:hypothetical protein